MDINETVTDKMKIEEVAAAVLDVILRNEDQDETTIREWLEGVDFVGETIGDLADEWDKALDEADEETDEEQYY